MSFRCGLLNYDNSACLYNIIGLENGVLYLIGILVDSVRRNQSPFLFKGVLQDTILLIIAVCLSNCPTWLSDEFRWIVLTQYLCCGFIQDMKWRCWILEDESWMYGSQSIRRHKRNWPPQKNYCFPRLSSYKGKMCLWINYELLYAFEVSSFLWHKRKLCMLLLVTVIKGT